MNQLPGKKERNAFNRASPAALAEGNDQELGELSLSGTHEQAVPFLRAASQLGGKVVQFAVQPVIDYNPRKISKKVLAAMSGDPDPVKTLSDIRSLLVGPTRSLHDAMFEEVIDILEESDREVQTALETLESNYYRLSDITDRILPGGTAEVGGRPAGNALRNVHGHRRQDRRDDRQGGPQDRGPGREARSFPA